MKVLIVKTSSLGDILHTFPAVTDAVKMIPNITFDWVVEENFSEVPLWHPNVDEVIPIAIRRWRKNFAKQEHILEIKKFLKILRSKQYDIVIDAQGLIKSAIITFLAKGKKIGLDYSSATEFISSIFYNKTVSVNLQDQAVSRVRNLFSKGLGYKIPDGEVDYGISKHLFVDSNLNKDKYIFFAHGTTWESKHWPKEYWIDIAKLFIDSGYNIRVPWHNEYEKSVAYGLASLSEKIHVIDKTSLKNIANIIAFSSGVVAVDTGFSHLAAALNVPAITLYGPSSNKRTGTVGKNQIHLPSSFSCVECAKKSCQFKNHPLNSSSCLSDTHPKIVFEKIMSIVT